MSHARSGPRPPEAIGHSACTEPDPADTHAACPAGLPPLLEEATRILENLGTPFAADFASLHFLLDRLEQGRLHLAILGQFKRGKSILLNALLGDAIRPTSVVPLTAIPTLVRAGDSLRARAAFQDERTAEELRGINAEELAAFLSNFVTESGNPKFRLGVSQVEVFHPAPILRKGVVKVGHQAGREWNEKT